MRVYDVGIPEAKMEIPGKRMTMIVHRRSAPHTAFVGRPLFACLFVIASLSGLYAQAPPERADIEPVSDLGQKALSRLILGKGFAQRTLGFQPFVRPLITADDWLGGSGNWNSTNWSTGSAPTSTNNAVITTSSSVVQLNVSDTINNLTIGGTSKLNFADSTSLTVGGTTISNAGTIALNSVGDVTALIIGASNVTLSGGGTVTMSSNGQNYIYGSAAANTLTNQGTIQGSGYVGFDPYTGNGSMGLVNSGTINANQSACDPDH